MSEIIKNPVTYWNQRLHESEVEIASEAPKWRTLYSLWRGITPAREFGDQTGLDEEADLFIHIIYPLIATFLAKELMYFFASNDSITATIEGTGENVKSKLLQDKLQLIMKFLFGQSQRYTRLYNTIQDKLVYGNCLVKVMPAEDPYDIFRTEIIPIWKGRWSPGCQEWEDVSWAGHKKLVPPWYFNNKDWYDLGAIREKLGSNTLSESDERFPFGEKKGIKLTEIWDKERNILWAFANDVILIRKEEFPYEFPFIMAADNTESNKILAFGEAELLKDIQIEGNILRNQRLNDIMLSVHGMFLIPPGVDEMIFQGATSGAMIPWSGGEKVEPIIAPDSTRSLQIDIREGYENAKFISGALNVMTGEMASKRMFTPEVVIATRNAGARFWMKTKNSETHFWLPWVEKIIGHIKDAPDDLFDKLVSPMDEMHDRENWEKVGRLTPSDLKNVDIQIQAKMSYTVMQDVEIRQRVLEALKIGGTIWPEYLDKVEALKFFLDTYKSIPGLKKIFKIPEPGEAYPSPEAASTTLRDLMQGIRQSPGGGMAQSRVMGEER